MSEASYETVMSSGKHWSLVIRRGMQLEIIDLAGGGNVGMLLYNFDLLSEKYNAPDTLKCQHTFKLSRGNCLYSDMGRIFCSIVKDSFGWHESICGNSHGADVQKNWGDRNYQTQSNRWLQNGNDAFLVELAKYGLVKKDLASNVNWFSGVNADSDGNIKLKKRSREGDSVSLRFEMDTLVVLHTCPHPLNTDPEYPAGDFGLHLVPADPIAEDDFCRNYCEENQRGFQNNALYHMGDKHV